MKIIVIENNYPQNPATTAGANEPIIYTLPDTALLKDHRPFFVPDFADPCTFQLHLVARICRLGRSISPRYAHRYYDAVTVGVTFTAENLLQDLKAKGMPWELAKGFDGAAALGSFLPIDQLENYLELPFTLKGNDELLQTGMGKDMLTGIDQLIADLSQYYTFKQGDFLFTGCPGLPTTAVCNTHITGYIGEEKLLSFNIK